MKVQKKVDVANARHHASQLVRHLAVWQTSHVKTDKIKRLPVEFSAGKFIAKGKKYDTPI